MTEAIGDSIAHGLIGLLGAVLLLEFFVRWKRNREIEPGILFLLTVATVVGIGAGAAYYLLPNQAGTELAPATPPHWPAGCMFGLGICAALSFYFKRRHRDLYLSEHERPTYFKINVMKHRRHAVEGNMQMGYTVMLFLATASLGAAAFIGNTQFAPDSDGGDALASSKKETDSTTRSNEAVPQTMAELLAQSDSEPDPEPEPVEPTTSMTDPEIVATDSTPEEDPEVEKPEPPAMADSGEPEPEPISAPSSPMASRAPTIGNPKDFNPQTKRPKNIPKDVFVSHIRPILSKNCFSCHGKEKQKGGLRLDTLEGIRKGGKGGAIIVAGDPERSSLYSSTVLPADDPDIMPAKGDPLVKRDTELLRKWILFGADLGDGKHIADASSGGAGFAVDQKANGVPLPDAALIESLKANGVHVRAVSANQSLLELDFTHLEDKSKLNLTSLAPISSNIHSIDLTRSRVKDADLAVVAQMKNLARLQLNQTAISDNGLKHLKALSSLETLNLYGTQVSDAGLANLTGLTNLKKLYLWESKATPEGSEKLKSKLPKLKVIF